jgi:hypothetical protein
MMNIATSVHVHTRLDIPSLESFNYPYQDEPEGTLDSTSNVVLIGEAAHPMVVRRLNRF